MTSEKPKWWKTPPYSNIVGGLTVALILWIIKTIYDWWKYTPVISTIGDWFRYMWDSLISFLYIPIPLGVVLTMFIWYFVLWSLHRKNKKKLIPQNDSGGSEMNLKGILKGEDGELTDLSIHKADKQNEAYIRKENRMLDYIADKFLNFTWEWEWIYNNKIHIYEAKNILPCCPTPKCDLSPLKTINNRQPTYTVYYCDICQTYPSVNKFTSKRMEDEIEKYIMAKVDKF